jgi:DNA-directed RNA polymerase specialized sigma24 family protein
MAQDGPGDQGPPGSVSRLIPDLKEGDRQAMQRLWECYFQPLVRLARGRLRPGGCRVAEAEEVALEAFLEFCDRLARPDVDLKFPRLHSREHLWKLLACFTVRTAFNYNQKQARRGVIVRGESALGDEGFAPFAGREPAPEFAAAVADLLDQLGDDVLRTVALRTMAGCTSAEIARELDCSRSTVERKLRSIRSIWKSRERDAQ